MTADLWLKFQFSAFQLLICDLRPLFSAFMVSNFDLVFQHFSLSACCRMVRVFGVFRGYQIRPLA
jgi:hypothetical protein